MAGLWKAWKTKSGFSTLPPAPWESRKKLHIPTASTADPYSPCKSRTARRTGNPGKVEIQERDSRFPTVAKPPAAQGEKFKNQYERGVLPLYEAPHFQDHLVLESKVVFRIILQLENAAPPRL